MKTCEEYQELVSAYVDGESTDAETAEVFFHLGSCRECREFITSVLKLQSLLQEPRAGSPTSRVQYAPTRPARTPVWKRKFSVTYPVAAAVIALMLMTGSFFIFEKSQPPTVIDRTQTAYVYITALPPVDVVASPLSQEKTN